jgi:8-oxo-dGTP diphosphatase
MEHEVKAAGCVVHRSGVAFAVIHRPRYDDWSLPKGKLDPGETFEDAAAREVEEEIGVHGELGDELPATEYTDNNGRPKIVRYWLLRADDPPEFEPNDEVDELRWLPATDALDLLSYDRDRDVLAAAVERL